MKPAPCRITRAAPGDVESILPLFDAYREFFAGSTDHASRHFLEDRLAAQESVIFVAWDGAVAAGFIQLYPLWSSWYCRRIWFLSDLFVAQPARGRSIGASLVARAIAYADETGAASVMVELPRREPYLTEFYAKLGFAKDEVFELARYLPGQTHEHLHEHEHYDGTVHSHAHTHGGSDHDHDHQHDGSSRDAAP
ncbi:MAG TPA: GNAT family N-acetyltransferase [Candidatus Cybelea sp.]|jgi:GNAT superfamily N-acetyltransferase